MHKGDPIGELLKRSQARLVIEPLPSYAPMLTESEESVGAQALAKTVSAVEPDRGAPRPAHSQDEGDAARHLRPGRG